MRRFAARIARRSPAATARSALRLARGPGATTFGSVLAGNIRGGGPNAVAKVDFGSSGTKRLLLRFSPVTKL